MAASTLSWLPEDICIWQIARQEYVMRVTVDNVLMLSSRSQGREKSARIPLTRILKKEIAHRAVQPCFKISLVYKFSVLYAIKCIYLKMRVKRTVT